MINRHSQELAAHSLGGSPHSCATDTIALLQEEGSGGVLVMSKSHFDALRRSVGHGSPQLGSAAISRAPLHARGSHEVAETSGSSAEATGLPPLAAFEAECPFNKIGAEMGLAEKLGQDGDAWRCLRARQDILGLVKVHCSGLDDHWAPGPDDFAAPMLLADAHLELARAYAGVNCRNQATDHIDQALKCMPKKAYFPSKERERFKREARVLIAELLLAKDPPQPDDALSHVCGAAGVSSTKEPIKSPGIRLIAAQCHLAMGVNQLRDATQLAHARIALETRGAQWTAQLLTMRRGSVEYNDLTGQLRDTHSSMGSDQGLQTALLLEAREQLDLAHKLMMSVVTEESERAERKGAGAAGKAFIGTLWGHVCEVLFRQAVMEGLAGNIAAELERLMSIDEANKAHTCVSDGLLARVLKELGAALVARSHMAHSASATMGDLLAALKRYEKLERHQSRQLPAGSDRLAAAVAEARMLQGNVHAALGDAPRATSLWDGARASFAQLLGSDHALPRDLAARAAQLRIARAEACSGAGGGASGGGGMGGGAGLRAPSPLRVPPTPARPGGAPSPAPARAPSPGRALSSARAPSPSSTRGLSPSAQGSSSSRGPSPVGRSSQAKGGGQSPFASGSLGQSSYAYEEVDAHHEEEYPNEGPTKYELSQRADKTRPLVTVRLSVHYRVHSRQILCIGGNQIPMGWSFLSIAKVPMTWNAGDVWSCEVQLQAGLRIEHKYVILEEQDWAPLVDLDSQGVVDMVTYRTGKEPSRPPTPQTIQKQMAIVAWQPGPNRIVQVPTEEEIANLLPGQRIQRVPPRPRSDAGSDADEVLDPFKGTWEVLTTDSQGRPLLDRHDVWGWIPSAGARPADNLKGFNLPGEGGGDAGQGR
ncbi:hypothetical protein FOA52_001892 [Chlamydomonas sp. UWO 241]|nr:hypothetical protein FOA52_001892 [Chlamydomonas sp. UWO 241]